MIAKARFDSSPIRQFESSRTAEHTNRRTVERFSQETQAAVEAARAAGQILLRQLGRARGIRFKSAKDPVTTADVAAERCIRCRLRRRFPKIGYLGEEGTHIDGSDGRWIVDPLDGTMVFIAGLPFFAVCIALERKGRIDLGVLYLPRLDEMYVAERGRGAFCNGRRIRVSPTTRLRDCMIALWHDDSVWGNRALRERIAALALQVRNVRIFGAGYALASVAAGRLDAYWEQSAYPWDIAAGALIVAEAGGRVTDGGGRPLDINQPTILASNGRIHRRLVTALAAPPGRATRS
jgi:myo-inositol-1(or 4)-monophosphatase